MWAPIRHLAHEGDRHTGRHGFSGSGCRPDPMPSHYSDQPRRHFVMSLPEYQRLLAFVRSEIVHESIYATAVGFLGGGYGGADVFIDRCPWDCPTRGEAVIGGYVFDCGVPTGERYADRLSLAQQILEQRVALRTQRPARDIYSFLQDFGS